MGVNNLWPILSEICERKPLTYLTGLNVAVDLSGWVVQAITCDGLNTSKNPHLKNLFYRLSKLLQLGVYPVFVTEGKPPDLKEEYFKEKNRYGGNFNPGGVSRSYFDETLKQCQDLLECLGVPCFQSSGEAEAFCAFLCLKGIVSGVITEDNDAFLYGADVIYRDFSIKENDSHVNVYCLKSEKNKLQLDREKLVAFALLLGCDYSKGVPGIGKENAKNLISELSSDDILQRFKDWKNLEECELFPGLAKEAVKKGSHCTRCGHTGALGKHKKEGCLYCDSKITCYLPKPETPVLCKCQWHVNEELKSKRKTELKIYSSVKKNCPDFPEEKVIEEYLNFTDKVPSEEELVQKCPDLMKFQEKASSIFGWTYDHSSEKVLPLITSWQQYKLKKFPGDESEFIYEPLKILKEHSKRGDSYYEVQWKLIDNNSESSGSENLITLEYGDRFGDCYKELVEAFKDALSKKKEEKQSKGKSKKSKAAQENRKVNPEPLHCNDPDVLNTVSPKTSPFEDSFDGLLDMPLWERVKVIPKTSFKDFNRTQASSSLRSNDDIANLLLDSCSDFSEILSPGLENSNFESVFTCRENLDRSSNFAFEGNEFSSLVSNLAENFNSVCRLDFQDSVFMDFNDSDDSFLNILSSQGEKYSLSDHSYKNKKSFERRLLDESDRLIANYLGEDKYDTSIDHQHDLSLYARKMPDRSPQLLYSTNQSSPLNRNLSNHRFSKIYNFSTPVLKEDTSCGNKYLSSPKPARLKSSFIYSSLIFDSSTEDWL